MGKGAKGSQGHTKKKTSMVEVAPLYSEDLGSQGVKRLRGEQSSPLAAFKLPLTSKEKKRRKNRMVRSFWNEVERKRQNVYAYIER